MIKKIFLLLLTIEMMGTTAYAQQHEQVLDFKSKSEKGVIYSITLDKLASIIETSQPLEDEIADKLAEDYSKEFHTNQWTPAVLILKSDISDIVLFVQYKEEDYLYSFRMFTEDGWLQATNKTKRLLEPICNEALQQH